jgi:hypothetical protein
MTGRLALLCCFALTVSAAASDGEPRLRFSKEVARGSATGEEILGIPLDSDIYATTRDDYRDLRIIDDRGAEVPYLLERVSRQKSTEVHEICTGKVVSLHVEEGKALEVVAALDDKAKNATGVTIQTPLSDYEHRVRVFGKATGGDWTPLVSDGLIFDYSRFMDIKNHDVSFPRNDYRQFKLVIEQELEEHESPFRELVRGQEEGKKDQRVEITQRLRRPFRIDGIELWRTAVRQEAETFPYPAAGLRVAHDAKEKTSRLEVESRREPLTRFSIQTSSRNFSRPARVFVPVERGIQTDWREVGQGTLSKIEFRAFRRAELRVDFPEHRHERYRLVIEDADNPPLEISGVEPEGTGYRLVFLGAPDRTYRVAYGSDTIEPPRYDTAAVLASLRAGYQVVTVKLGPQVQHAVHRSRWGLRDFLNSAFFLAVAILATVLVLAWALFRAGKRIQKMPQQDV